MQIMQGNVKCSNTLVNITNFLETIIRSLGNFIVCLSEIRVSQHISRITEVLDLPPRQKTNRPGFTTSGRFSRSYNISRFILPEIATAIHSSSTLPLSLMRTNCAPDIEHAKSGGATGVLIPTIISFSINSIRATIFLARSTLIA